MKTVVFLGNPNVGKSALINAISDSHLTVGNWPGVTVSKNEAVYTYKGEEVKLIDLPGAYQLDDDTAEEHLTGEFLLEGHYDLIIDVVDATNLNRNLYMTLLARELQKPMVLLLNFDDELQKSGTILNTDKLQQYLQMPIIRTSAMKNYGIEEVKDYIHNFKKGNFKPYNIYYSSTIDNMASKIHGILVDDNVKVPPYGLQYLAYRLLEKNPNFVPMVSSSTLAKINTMMNNDVSLPREETYSNLLQVSRFKQIDNVLKQIIDKSGVHRYEFTRKVDNIILNKWLGLPIMVLFTIYFLSLIFNVANPLVDWIDGFINDYIGGHVSLWIQHWPDWIQSMIMDGIIAGLGGVIVFTPLMYFIYFLMAVIEETGMMSRIAFLMDMVMRKFGLSGKAFISMVIGFGCTVPAITSTRALASDNARKRAAMMLPFISCGARLPVYALFVAAFFSRHAGLVVASLYILGIFIAVLVGLVMKALNIYEVPETDGFTIELPPYRLPEKKVLFKNVNLRLKNFLRNIITTIFIVMMGMWALNYFPSGNAHDSFLTRGTKIIQPLFRPAGFGNSEIAVASLPSAIVAKEAVVASINTLGAADGEDEEVEIPTLAEELQSLGDALVESVTSIFAPLRVVGLFSVEDATDDEVLGTVNVATHMFTGPTARVQAYAYMVYILLLVPCIVAIAAIKKEFGRRFMWQSIALTLIVPYIVAVIVYQVGSLIIR